MENIIVKYQRAFNSIIDRLKRNKNVVAAAVFGSIVTGDIWDESDIDLIVVMDNQKKPLENIYSTIDGVSAQIKFVSRDYIKNVQDDYFIEKLKMSKTVFCNDSEIEKYMNGVLFNMKLDNISKNNDVKNLVYLGKVLKDINVIKKYLHNNSDYIAYSVAVRCAESFCSYFLSLNRYTVSKDSITLAVNLNDDIKNCIDKLFFNKNHSNYDNIVEFINFTEKYLEKTCVTSTLSIINILTNEKRKMSSCELNDLEQFKGMNIKMEEILEFMYKNKIVFKDLRDYKDSSGNNILKQNVYYV